MILIHFLSAFCEFLVRPHKAQYISLVRQYLPKSQLEFQRNIIYSRPRIRSRYFSQAWQSYRHEVQRTHQYVLRFPLIMSIWRIPINFAKSKGTAHAQRNNPLH